MNDFTMLALWKVHTEYKNKILLSIREWEGLFKPVVPPQPEPAPLPVVVAQSTAPDNKNYKSRPELKPDTLTAKFNPLELAKFIAQATNWMKQNWNDQWESKIVTECQIVLDSVLFNKMNRKIDFATDNWDKFKAALEEICLISHTVFKRQWEVFRCQGLKKDFLIILLA